MTQKAFYFISIDSFLKMSPSDFFYFSVFYLSTPISKVYFVDTHPKTLNDLSVYDLDYKFYFLEKNIILPLYIPRLPKMYSCLFFDNFEDKNIKIDLITSK